jgi:thiol-disulfide isomerase/thioredoxin
VRIVACVALLSVGLLLAGCSTFNKKPAQAKTGPNRPSDRPWWENPQGNPSTGTPSGPIADRSAPAPPQGSSGILAGQVIDVYNRRPPPTLIQVVCVDDKQSGGAPLDVAADSTGYFIIQGLQPGKHYQLIARAKDGDRTLSGSTYATPPYPKVLIRISEDLAGANGKGPTTPLKPAAGVPPPPDWGSSNDPANAPPSGVDIGPPAKGKPAAPVFGADPSHMADKSPPASASIAPAEINGPNSPRRDLPEPARPLDPSPKGALCKLTDGKVDNFILPGVDGERFDFQKDHRGRVVLLDFWGTWCGPCRDAIWHLKALNNTYHDYGLEIIGVAEEQGNSMDHARKVAGIRQRYSVNYRLLLGNGADADCPMTTEFGIRAYPTLVLLDDTGRILWRSEGLIDPRDPPNIPPRKLKELEGIIRSQLGIR